MPVHELDILKVARMYFRGLDHTESKQICLEATSKDQLASPATLDMESQHLCHLGCSSIPPLDLMAKMTTLANIKQ